MALAISMVLAAIALPTMTSSIEAYRLNSATQQVANLIEVTRYTAIHRNTSINLQMTTQGSNTVFYVDLDKNGALDPGEPQVLLPSDMQLVNGQLLVPPASTTGLGSIQDFVTQITFDYRGTVNLGQGVVYFLAIGYTNQVQSGFRGISVTPMGQTKLWIAPSGGTWTAQ
jgi:Tfp pilus assembly protein FimT